jgi:peptide/nickel transport system substrate-binding protein
MDRRAFLKHTGLVAAGLGVVGAPGLLVACGGGSAKGTTGSSSSATNSGTASAKALVTLNYPFLADMQVPDPDIFYEGEGLQVTLSVYEGLLQYAPNPPNTPVTYRPVAQRVAPALAKAWEVSADGLTYTFHLQPGVKFHDGTTMDAESWRKGFDRRLTVNQGPAYMVVPVASTAAPDPLTFVVTLKHPVDPFLDYLACPWGPKAVSPTAVAAHAVGNDVAQKWLTTNDAGTGPFKITEFVPADHYTLEVFADYWGPKPELQKVIISIIPDLQTQEIKFKGGELDMITKGLPIQDVQSFQKDAKFTVTKFATVNDCGLYFNNTKGRLFADPAVRKAARHAINRDLIVNAAYKDTAKVARQFFPEGDFPDGAAPDDPVYDPSQLPALTKNLSSKKVDLAYGLNGGAGYRLMADLIQTQLQAAGLDVSVRGLPTSQEFSLYNTPDGQRPDLLIDFWGGDAMHVDTDVRIVFRTGAAPLNWFNYSVPEADTAMDLGASATDQSQVIAHYAASAAAISNEAFFLHIANLYDVFVARAGITNLKHDPMAAQTVRFADLKSG